MKTSGPLEVAEFADEAESPRAPAAGGTGANSYGRRPLRTIVAGLRRLSDLCRIGVRLELADEDEGIGHPFENAFGAK